MKRGLIIGIVIVVFIAIILSLSVNTYLNISKYSSISGLYIPELSMQTSLPEENFSYEIASGMMNIKKDGENYFVIYPLIQGMDIKKEYQLDKSDFKTGTGGVEVYKKEMSGNMAYLVDWKLPFFIFAASEGEIAQINLDIEKFLNGVVYKKRTVSQSADGGGIKTLIEDIERYMPNLSESIKRDILETYKIEELKYSKPIKTSEEYLEYVRCINHMLDIIIDEWPWPVDMYTRYDISRYFNYALVEKYGHNRLYEIDSLGDSIPSDQFKIDIEGSCSNFPVPVKFKS